MKEMQVAGRRYVKNDENKWVMHIAGNNYAPADFNHVLLEEVYRLRELLKRKNSEITYIKQAMKVFDAKDYMVDDDEA